jgi:hypothetical protein
VRPSKSSHRVPAGSFRLGGFSFKSQDARKPVESLGDVGVLVTQEIFSNRERFTK